MPLPRINQPIFELTIPSTGLKAKYRPFTVREEKILLIAQESKEIEQIVLSIKQIVNNCLQDVDVDDLAMFDMEYILMNIRAKSVNNEVTFNVKDPDTEETVELTIDINEVTIEKQDNHNPIIDVTDEIKLKMKYPGIDLVKSLVGARKEDATGEERSGKMLEIMASCIDTVIDGDEVYRLVDFTEQEVSDFIDSLNSVVLSKIKEFFDTMPTMRLEKKYINKEGKEKTFVAKGTETFFI